jgi:hypothetical protein
MTSRFGDAVAAASNRLDAFPNLRIFETFPDLGIFQTFPNLRIFETFPNLRHFVSPLK